MIFELIDCLNELTLDDLNQLKDLFDIQYISSFTVLPQNQSQK